MTEAGYISAVTAPPIQALIIRADGTYEVRETAYDLRTFQKLVGGYIEPVDAGDALFWLNEEGKIHDKPFNSMATWLWWKLVPAMEGLDDIRGTAIVTGPSDEAGDPTPIPEHVVEFYRRMEAIRLTRSNEDPSGGEGHAP